MNNLDKDYLALCQDILDNGIKKKTRTGTDAISVFGRHIRHKMSDGFPLLTTKKMYWKGIVNELLWFLRGDTNIKFLVDNDCYIWDGDAYKNYCMSYKDGHEFYEDEEIKRSFTQEEFINKIKTDDEFAKKWGELGPIYGKQWRSWGGEFSLHIGLESDGSQDKINFKKGIDQIANLIHNLKTNPDSRRLMVSAWNVGELDEMVLPPCHYGFQVYTRELSLEERLCIADKFNPLIREDCLTKTHHPDETEELKLVYRHEFLDSLGPNVVPQRRAISLLWNQRSVDVPLGLPFNLASYGLLLHILAKITNMVPDELIGNLGDCHIYENQIEGIKEQMGRDLTLEERKTIYEKEFTPGMIVQNNHWLEPKLKARNIPTRTREPYPLPSLRINTEFWPTESGECGVGELTNNIDHLIKEMKIDDFQIENYKSHPAIKIPLSN